MKHVILTIATLLLLAAAPVRAEILTLRDCLTRAAAANYALKVTAYDEKIADDNVAIAKSSYLPRIDFQGGLTAQLEPQSVLINGHAVPTQQADFGFFSFALNQTLYDFGRSHARYQRALLLKEAVVKEQTGRVKDTFLQVVEAYYGILEAKKLLQAADEEVVQRKDHLRVAQNLYEQGVVTRNDLLQAEVKLADSRQRRLSTANRVENGWLYLNYLIGHPSSFRAELEEAPESSQPDMGGNLEEKAIAARPEIAALKLTVNASDYEVKESKDNFYPELFAKLGVDYVQNRYVQEQAMMYATFGVRMNLFDGFVTTSRLRQAVNNRSRNEERLRLQEAQILLELQTAQNDARVAAERITTVKQAIVQGEENLRINRDRYLEQVGTATDVIDAQTLLTQTKTDYHRAVYDYLVATARLKKAVGEL